MSVLECDRYHCDHIMCDDTILGGKYYICEYCLKELRGASKSLTKKATELDIREFIEEFMNDERESYRDRDIEAAFEHILDHQEREL